MIIPDTKDWTWVLERACPECGFDAAVCPPEAVAGLVRANAVVWGKLLADGVIRPGRPDRSTWSSLEYACHVRDVCQRFRARIDLMLSEDDPLFANWDQDASAADDGYEQQDPAAVVGQLTQAAEEVAGQLESVPGPAWQRPGRRSNGSAFTVATISRYMVHDTIHHVWDVRQAQR